MTPIREEAHGPVPRTPRLAPTTEQLRPSHGRHPAARPPRTRRAPRPRAVDDRPRRDRRRRLAGELPPDGLIDRHRVPGEPRRPLPRPGRDPTRPPDPPSPLRGLGEDPGDSRRADRPTDLRSGCAADGNDDPSRAPRPRPGPPRADRLGGPPPPTARRLPGRRESAAARGGGAGAVDGDATRVRDAPRDGQRTPL